MQPRTEQTHLDHELAQPARDGEVVDESPSAPSTSSALSFDAGVAPRQAHQIRGAELRTIRFEEAGKRPTLPPREPSPIAVADAVANADEVDSHLELAIRADGLETPIEAYDFLTTASEFPDADAPVAEAIESELADATELAIDTESAIDLDDQWLSAGPLRTGRASTPRAITAEERELEAIERIATRWTGGPIASSRTEHWVRPTIPLPITP